MVKTFPFTEATRSQGQHSPHSQPRSRVRVAESPCSSLLLRKGSLSEWFTLSPPLWGNSSLLHQDGHAGNANHKLIKSRQSQGAPRAGSPAPSCPPLSSLGTFPSACSKR